MPTEFKVFISVFWYVVGMACGTQWTETQCPPRTPFSFCTLESLGCEAGGFYITFSPDGQLLATLSDPPNNVIHIWEVSTTKEIATIRAPAGSMFVQTLFAPNKGWAISTLFPTPAQVGSLATVAIWELASSREVWILKTDVDYISVSPDGNLLAASSFRGSFIRLWNLTTAQELDYFPFDFPEYIVFSPTGSLLIVSRGKAALLDVWKKAMSFVPVELSLPVVFSPDGSVLASGFPDGTIKLYSTNDWREMRTLAGHSGAIIWLTFSYDGRILASSAKDQTVRFWDAHKGREVYKLDMREIFNLGQGYPPELRALIEKITAITIAFSPTAPILASGIRTLIPKEGVCPCQGMAHLWNIGFLWANE